MAHKSGYTPPKGSDGALLTDSAAGGMTAAVGGNYFSGPLPPAGLISGSIGDQYMTDAGSLYLKTIEGGNQGWVKASSYVIKRCAHTIGSPNALFSEGGNTTYVQRTLLEMSHSSLQWRLKIANQNAKDGTNPNQASMVDSVWIGTPAYAVNGQWVGACSTAMNQVLGPAAAAVLANGSDVRTAMITAPGSQWVAHTQIVLGMAITIPTGGTGAVQADCQAYTGVGINALVGLAATPGAAGPWVYDVQVEYDALVPAGTPVVLYVCASDGSYSPDGNSILPLQAYPNASALQNNSLVIDAALGGSVTSDWTSLAGRPWTRFDLTTYPPDCMVIGCVASNDIAGLAGGDTATGGQVATALASIQTNISSILANAATLGIKRTYLCTIPPRNFPNAGQFENLRGQVNSWIRQLPRGVESIIDLDLTLRSPSVFRQIDPLLVSSDGIHFNQAGHQRAAQTVRMATLGTAA